MEKVTGPSNVPAAEETVHAVVQRSGTAANRARAATAGQAPATPASVAARSTPAPTHVGRYALKSVIAEGGLGCVFEAWDPLLSRTVAVKTLQFGLGMDSRIALDRLLLNEARAAANLNHRYIVTVHDAGLSAHGVYLAMERLQGRDLRQALAEGWHPSVREAVRIARRVADALAYAHARGVIHCDVKPGNIFLTRSGRPKVLDFGIARVATHAQVPELNGYVLGSPPYLSPEQLATGAIDLRTDIYSLGVVLYEMLAGRRAFAGSTQEELRAAVIDGDCKPLAELVPHLPKALVQLVERSMAADAQRRPASARAVAAALRRIEDGLGPEDGTRPTPAVQQEGTRGKRWSWRWTFSGGTLAALAMGLLSGAHSGD